MTNQEAIEELQLTIDLIKQNGKDWLDERDIPILSTAIEAMKELNALQEQNSPTRMSGTSDSISRQAAIDAADRADYTGLAVEDVKKVTDEVVKELKQLPSAQSELEDKIRAIGYTGKEGRIYIGGRLFAVRELPQ